MNTNAYKMVFTILVIVGMQSCTTAIDDPGDITTLPPITERVTYEGDVRAIIANNCLTCHGTLTQFGNLELTTFNLVKTAAESRNLIPRINDAANPMPQAGLMTVENRQKIQKWVDDGFPEN